MEISFKNQFSGKNPYITEGLVSMFDGEWNQCYGKHTQNTSEWVDLISGKSAEVKESRFGNNYYQRYTSDKHLILPVFLRDFVTVSMVIAVEDDSYTNTYFFGTDEQFYTRFELYGVNSTIYRQCFHGFMMGRNQSGWFSRPVDKIYFGIGRYFITFVRDGRNSLLYCNDNLPIRFSSLHTVEIYEKSQFNLGAWYESREALTGKIYNVRFYDRMLTPYEINMNYDVDKRRFGIV